MKPPKKQKGQKIHITEPNVLVNALYNLTTAQKRIILAAFYKVDTTASAYLDWIELDLEQLHADCGKTTTDKKEFYKTMQKALSTLHTSFITFDDPANKEYTNFSWIAAAKYSYSGKTMSFKLTPDMAKLLANQKEQFTQIEYLDVMKLHTGYAMRIYSMLMQWQNSAIPYTTIEADKLRKILQTQEKYPLMSLFNQKVLQPALDDINANTKYNVAIDKEKEGKTIIQFKFFVSSKQISGRKQTTMNKNEVNPRIEKEVNPRKKPEKIPFSKNQSDAARAAEIIKVRSKAYG